MKVINIKTKNKFIRYQIKGCFDCPFLDERCYSDGSCRYFCCVRGIDREVEVTSDYKSDKDTPSACPLPNL